DGRPRRQRRRRQAPAPDAGAARPVHDPAGVRPHRGPARRDRRRRAPLARRALEHPGARHVRRARDSGRAAHADPARDRGDGLRVDRGHRRDRRGRRRLRPAHAARADARGRELRAEPARVHGALGSDAGAAAARPEGDAPRPDEPRRRDRPARRRFAGRADRGPGALGPRHEDGGALRPAHPRPRRRPHRSRDGGGVMLFSRNGYYDSRVIEGARVIDPVEGIDAALTVTVENGVITRLEPASARPGFVLAPAFVDPHVHLRTPGREDEETIASGTGAAAAGGYCAILAIPNTEPVVDSAAVLASLVEKAKNEALVPVGFMAAISKGQQGTELTEMGELAEAGAAGFTDDGRPVVSPGLMRRALQYSPVAGRRIAVHCEEPSLTRGAQMHEGVVSAELGFGGYPSVGESVMVERDLSLAGYEGQPIHLMHLSARESVEALSRAQAGGVQATGEVTPHHLCLTDEAVRS